MRRWAYMLGAGVALAWLSGAAAQEGAVTGRLEPRETIAVGAQVNGPITRLLVGEGEQVEEGELLARIDPARYKARLDEAEARKKRAEAVAEESQRELERQQQIYDRGLSAKHDLEIAQRDARRDNAEVDEAAAAVRKAKVNLGYTRITAPRDGVILERNVQSGETVVANLEPPVLFRMAPPLTKLHAVVQVDPQKAGGLSEGAQARVTFPEGEAEERRGQVVQVADTTAEGSSGGAGYNVRIRVANPDRELRPGMEARVRFLD